MHESTVDPTVVCSLRLFKWAFTFDKMRMTSHTSGGVDGMHIGVEAEGGGGG